MRAAPLTKAVDLSDGYVLADWFTAYQTLGVVEQRMVTESAHESTKGDRQRAKRIAYARFGIGHTEARRRARA